MYELYITKEKHKEKYEDCTLEYAVEQINAVFDFGITPELLSRIDYLSIYGKGKSVYVGGKPLEDRMLAIVVELKRTRLSPMHNEYIEAKYYGPNFKAEISLNFKEASEIVPTIQKLVDFEKQIGELDGNNI